MQDWFFPINLSPRDERVDKLIDSKFGIDKIGSFVREIIQNCLDAHNDKLGDIPVVVEFTSKTFSLNQIPGGERLKEIINKCVQIQDLNHQTRSMYTKGLDTLSSNKITCLKISDKNTIGVEPGIDKAWGAFVYDEGISKKPRPGSAGSHGVGKKAPFIISGVHTVYYSTNFSGKRLFEGKTSLVSWSENKNDYDYVGWYGDVNCETNDRKKKVLPIEYQNELNGIDEFFYRKDENGTDVVIIDSNSIGQEKDSKISIINAILENFFVAIVSNKLECNVFGELINNETIDSIVNKYYNSRSISFRRSGESERVYDGNLKDYYRVYKDQQPYTILNLVLDGVTYGSAEIYFDLKNEKNKKYYCIVREHGMKIKDVRLNADQAFTAVVVIRNNNATVAVEEDKINGRLASRENAAHDDFIINDDQVPCDPTTKKLIELMYNTIENYLINMTELKVDDQSFLDSLSDMLFIPGGTFKGNIKKKIAPKVKKKKKKLLEQGRGTESEDGKNGTSVGHSGKGNGGKGTKKKVIIGDNVNAYLYKNFKQEPVSLNLSDKYLIKFIPNNNGYAIISVKPVSVDGGESLINNIVKEAQQNGKVLKIKGNYIYDVKLKQGQLVTVDVILQDGLDYVIECDVLMEAKDED